MKCPFCSHEDTKVNDSRPTDDDSKIRRRRECLKCGKRFTTYEIVETAPLFVVKKDGTREQFIREKMVDGIVRACEKRPIAADRIDDAVDSIELKLLNSMEREITSQQIGELVMEELKKIDDVAYVRFASVYREFKDINTFMEELKVLLDNAEAER